MRDLSKELQCALTRWSSYEKLVAAESIIRNAVERNPLHTDLEQVLEKVSLINELYSAGVQDIVAMAEHILLLQNLDSLLKDGDLNVVENIANYETSVSRKKIRCYSFATKYCAFHNPIKYPIYDKFVAQRVLELTREIGYHVTAMELKKYTRFKDAIDRIIAVFCLENDYNKVDKYLWLQHLESADSVWNNGCH